jgi:hypothetical protein
MAIPDATTGWTTDPISCDWVVSAVRHRTRPAAFTSSAHAWGPDVDPQVGNPDGSTGLVAAGKFVVEITGNWDEWLPDVQEVHARTHAMAEMTAGIRGMASMVTWTLSAKAKNRAKFRNMRRSAPGCQLC